MTKTQEQQNQTTAPAKADDKATEFVPLGCTDKIRLTAAMVRQFIAVPTKSGALPTERDCIRFIMLCRGKRANPFEGDTFMIGYDTQNGPSFSMVCGIELFLKRAEQSDNYDGRESGVIVQTEAGLIERAGTIVLEKETLVGGWARVHRKDRAHPDYKTVNFAVYDTGRSRWEKDPGGQIEKVALSQALRSAYPTALGGLYSQEEMQRLTEMGQGMIAAPDPIAMPKALEEPKGKAKQPPASAEAPQPDAPPAEGQPELSIQQQLAAALGDAGVAFDDLRDFLATKRLLPDADSVGSFDELPADVCVTLSKTPRLMSELIKKFGAVKV